MNKIYVVSLFSPLLMLLSGCGKTEMPRSEKIAAPTQPSSIVIDIGEQLVILHEAHTGQTLEWKSNSPNTPNFWIQFAGTSPCANGALVLSGSVTSAASCVAGTAAGTGGTITYSYYIRASQPPPLSPSGPTADRIARCLGCNN